MVRALGSKTGLVFDDKNPIIPMQGGGAAASLSTLPDVVAALERNRPDYTGMGAAAVQAHNIRERANDDAITSVLSQKAISEANIEATEIVNKQWRKDARQNASNSTLGTVFEAGVPLIASAVLGLSDERTKNTIKSIDDALNTLRELKPVTYYYNEEYSSNPERLHHGFIAQDYAKVLPSATYYDESIDRLCIDTSELIALLVRAVQQLETRIARMEAKSALVEV